MEEAWPLDGCIRRSGLIEKWSIGMEDRWILEWERRSMAEMQQHVVMGKPLETTEYDTLKFTKGKGIFHMNGGVLVRWAQ